MSNELRKLVETSNVLYRNATITSKTIDMHNFLEALANAEAALSSDRASETEFPEAEFAKWLVTFRKNGVTPNMDDAARWGVLFASEKAGKRILELTKEIADLKSQLEQAKKEYKDADDNLYKFTVRLHEVADERDLLREQLEQANAGWKQLHDTNELCINNQHGEIRLLTEQLTQAQAEKIEAAKDAARYADLFYKALAEKDTKC